jgi:hypothetical protein
VPDLWASIHTERATLVDDLASLDDVVGEVAAFGGDRLVDGRAGQGGRGIHGGPGSPPTTNSSVRLRTSRRSCSAVPPGPRSTWVRPLSVQPWRR